MRRTLEDVLVEAGVLDEGRLRDVRRYARHHGVCLARAAVERGGVDDELLAATVAAHLRLPRVDVAEQGVDEDALREVPFDLAEQRILLPLGIERTDARRLIRVAMADPLDFDATEEIEMSTGCRLEPVVGRLSAIADAVMRYYRGVITKMIPRRPIFGVPATTGAGGSAPAAPRPEPTTQPHHVISDEAPPDVALRALVELLIDRGIIDRDSWQEQLRRSMREHAGE